MLTIWHLTEKTKRNDHVEMCLHHLLTLSLYFGAYIMSDIESGLVVSFLMDFCDIWTHLAKGLVDTQYVKTVTLCGALMWIFWGYTRIFCFPIHVYYAYVIYPFELPNMKGSYEGNLYFFKASLLGILGIMGVFWWYLISKMTYNALFKGVRKDI